MPELVTHAVVGWFVARTLLRWVHRVDVLAVTVGACVPDWASHAFVLWPGLFEALCMLHEPVPLVLLCGLLATFAKAAERLRCFCSLLLGVATHYLLDYGQAHAFATNRPLFPFSYWGGGWDLYSIEASLWVMPFLLFVAALVLWSDRRIARRRRFAAATPDSNNRSRAGLEDEPTRRNIADR